MDFKEPVMKALSLSVIVLHGLIHLLGFVKAFGLADVRQLTIGIPRMTGLFWLITAILFVAAAIVLGFDSRSWWIPAGLALVFSQILIVTSWSDAKFGTVANVIILVPVLIAMMESRPTSFRSRYDEDVRLLLARSHDSSTVTEDDLAHLPSAVQRYVQITGSVGKPRVYNFRAVNDGTMKRDRQGDWMPIRAEQYNFYGERARLFYIRSSMFGLPFDGYHRYVGSEAVMQISFASLVQVVDARGPEMNRGETVTLFNDMCLLAPATLIDPSIRWREVDSSRVEATFTNGGNTITARLTFNARGELINFISQDRSMSMDGKTFVNYPWSTPVGEYREFEGRRIAAAGDAVWHTPEGEYVYARFVVKEIEFNCSKFK
jgi:hypothetical protein